jgi:AraC family transcriptional regulator
MKPSTEQDYRERIVRALVYIQQHPDDDLELEQVAGVAAFSSFHFHRIFRGLVGETLKEHTRRLRLERAAHKPAPESESGTHFDDVSGYHPPDYDDIPAVEVKELPPMRMVFLRHVGPYTQVGATWGRLMAWAGRRGLLGPNMKLIGIVHDDPDVTPPDKVRYDAAVTVNRPVQSEGDFGVMEFPGGPAELGSGSRRVGNWV